MIDTTSLEYGKCVISRVSSTDAKLRRVVGGLFFCLAFSLEQNNCAAVATERAQGVWPSVVLAHHKIGSVDVDVHSQACTAGGGKEVAQ